MRAYIHIGPCPPEEDAVQIGEGSFEMQKQCNRYIAKLREFFGDEPEGARLSIKREEHEFGNYYEVVCYYDSDNEISAKYAIDCEDRGPMTWDDKPSETSSCLTGEQS